MRRVRALGVPYNSSGLIDGVARAPDALRRAGLIETLLGAAVDVIDDGNVDLGPTSPERDPSSRLIAPGALRQMVEAVRARVEAIERDGDFPLVIGGDCPILLGCLGPGGRQSPLGVLFVDGHEDAWPPADSMTGEAADMELGFALGLTTAGLQASLRETFPIVEPGRVVILGARDERELGLAGVPSVEGMVAVVRPDAIMERGPQAVAADVVRRLEAGGDWWLHVDLDVLSSESLAAVDYPQPGGLGWEALVEITRSTLASSRCEGWTVTIYNPDLDPGVKGAADIVAYIAAALRD